MKLHNGGQKEEQKEKELTNFIVDISLSTQ
jgi:hypothetical protein